MVGRLFTQLILNVFHLLLQEEFTLLLVQFLTGLVLYTGFEGLKLKFPIEYLQQFICSRFFRIYAQQVNLFLNRNINVGGNEINQYRMVGNILYRNSGIVTRVAEF